MFYIQRCSIFSALLLKLRTLIAMYAKFIPIFAVESFVSFSFTGDYVNLEMFNIFYLLGVYYKDVYFCMIFNLFSFFQEIHADSHKNSHRLHSRNILPLAIYMVHDYSFFGSTADFVMEKEHLGFLPDLASPNVRDVG